MKRNLTRKIINALGLTTAMFIFQACYGTPQDFGYDVLIEGTVKAKKTGLPIKGIKVSVIDNMQSHTPYGITGDDGYFTFYSERLQNLPLRIDDIDMENNGSFFYKDTVIANPGNRIYLNITLAER